MLFKILSVVFFLVTVLGGRWMFKNPRKIYPGWAYISPDPLLPKILIRSLAVFFMMSGTFGAVSMIVNAASVRPFIATLTTTLTTIAVMALIWPKVRIQSVDCAGPKSMAEKPGFYLTPKGKLYALGIICFGIIVGSLAWALLCRGWR
jgi:hypothetical protein